MQSLRRDIYDLFNSDFTVSLNAEKISKSLNVELKRIYKALYAMKENGTLIAEGPVPHSYRLNVNSYSQCRKNKDINKLKGLGKKIIEAISSADAPLGAKELSELLNTQLPPMRYCLCMLKKRKFIESVGCTPYSYVLHENYTVPNAEVPDKVVKHHKIETNSVLDALYEKVSLEQEFLIVSKINGKTDVKGFENSDEFTSAFALLQKIPGLQKISGYRQIKCTVVLTPEIE